MLAVSEAQYPMNIKTRLYNIHAMPLENVVFYNIKQLKGEQFYSSSISVGLTIWYMEEP